MAVDRKESDEDPAVKARHRETYRQLLMALRDMPEVEMARRAFTGPYANSELGQQHAPGRRAQGPITASTSVTDDYLALLQIPLVDGRWFSREDDAATWEPVVVNRRMATRDLRRRRIRSGKSSRRSATPTTRRRTLTKSRRSSASSA